MQDQTPCLKVNVGIGRLTKNDASVGLRYVVTLSGISAGHPYDERTTLPILIIISRSTARGFLLPCLHPFPADHVICSAVSVVVDLASFLPLGNSEQDRTIATPLAIVTMISSKVTSVYTYYIHINAFEDPANILNCPDQHVMLDLLTFGARFWQ